MYIKLTAIAFMLFIAACSGSDSNKKKDEKSKPEPLDEVAIPTHIKEPARDVSSSAIIITNARIISVSSPSIEKGWIHMEKGNIVDLGDGAAPKVEGATVIDGTGKVITPGMIDTHSHMGVYPGPGVRAHSDGNESVRPNTADVWAEHAFWPQDPAIWRALSSGITTIQVLPGSANLFGGRSFTAKTLPKISAREMKFPNAPQGLKMACGENPKRVYGEKGGPSTRMGNMAGYKKSFQAAFEYKQKWSKYQRDLEHWKKRRTEAQKDEDKIKEIGDSPTPPTINLAHETLKNVIEGNILVHWHCYRADEMSQMLDLAKTYGFTVRSFHHAIEAYKIADKLAAAGTGVSTWADWWGFKMEAYDATVANAAITQKAGVKTIIHSDSATEIRHLHHEVAKIVQSGKELGIKITEEQAMAWVTLNPAWAIGVDDKVGSLEKGKHADVIIWDRHPFSIYAKTEKVLIDGHIVFDRKKEIVPTSDFELGQRIPKIGSQDSKTPFKDHTMSLYEKEVNLSSEMTPNEFLIDDITFVNQHGDLIENQSLLIKNGKIVQIGKEISWAGVKIDGKDKFLTPGLFETVSSIGLVEVSMVKATNNASNWGENSLLNADYNAALSYNPMSTRIPISRSEGVLYALSSSSNGLFKGNGFFVTLSEDSQNTINENVIASVGLNTRHNNYFGSNTGKMWQGIMGIFQEARFLQENKSAYIKGQLRDLKYEADELLALLPILDGKVPLFVNIDRYVDILNLLKLKSQMKRQGSKLNLVIVGGAESWLHAEELAKENIPVIVNPLAQGTFSFDHIQNRDDLATVLKNAGVEVLFSNLNDFYNLRRVRQAAGAAVANGFPYKDALKAITSLPAELFGLKSKVPHIEEGQKASFVLWSNDPLEPLSTAERMWVEGKELNNNNRQRELAKKYL